MIPVSSRVAGEAFMSLRKTIITAALGVLAASPALAQKVPAAQLPKEVTAKVAAAAPGMTIVEAELKEREGRRYYDVEGKLADGSELELDLLETPQGWTVVEIQRDIAWAAVPKVARDAAAPAWKAAAPPVRVIESKQTDGQIIYELFVAGKPQTPALEVAFKDGAAKVLTEVWPH
jgi:hypothetical protein